MINNTNQQHLQHIKTGQVIGNETFLNQDVQKKNNISTFDILLNDNDLDAFERAIAQQHGGLTDRESLAVAVLAAGLTQ